MSFRSWYMTAPVKACSVMAGADPDHGAHAVCRGVGRGSAGRSVQKGVSLVEMIVAVPVLLLLGMAVIQMILIFHARQSVTYALQEAVRQGAVEHADEHAITQGFARGLVPWLYGANSLSDKMLKEKEAMLHVAKARVQRWLVLEQLSPTRESFEDWSVPARDPFGEIIAGQREIPNDNLDSRRERSVPATGIVGYAGSAPIGRQSGQTLADANLLRVEATYGVPLVVPGISRLFLKAMRAWYGCESTAGALANAAAGDRQCLYYLQGRIPIRVVAMTRMMSPARPSPLLSATVSSHVSPGQVATSQGSGEIRPLPVREAYISHTGPAPHRSDSADFHSVDEGPVRWGSTTPVSVSGGVLAAGLSRQEDIPGESFATPVSVDQADQVAGEMLKPDHPSICLDGT